MKRHIRISFGLSILLPVAAFVVIVMRMLGEYRWHLAGALYGLGWLALLQAIRRHRLSKVLVAQGERKTRGFLHANARFISVFLFSLTLIVVGRVVFPSLTADEQAVMKQVDTDLRMLPVYIRGLEEVRNTADARRSELAPPAEGLRADQRRDILALWSTSLDYSMELEKIKGLHRYFYRIKYWQHPDLNLRSFLCGYAALVAQMQNAFGLLAITANHDAVETVLNEANMELGIPDGAFTRLKQGVTDPEALLLLHAGQAHLTFAKLTKRLASPDEQYLIEYAERGYRAILKAHGLQAEVFTETPQDIFERYAGKAWLPFQKGVAEGMSKVRVAHRENFISASDLEQALPKMRPGDIMMERRNWYLTNVGIPGFWPHVALFTGTLAEMDDFFKDSSVLKGERMSERIKAVNPLLHQQLMKGDDEGHSFRVLEALGPGVIPTTFEHSGKADYLCVLRPMLDREELCKALLNAFAYYSRPYDYNFDFMTDNELVCSELAYKSYQPDTDQKGLHFTLVETSGRLLLPPNNIVRKFDEEYGSARQELDFVLFLEGSEAEKCAYNRSVDDLRSSWKRSKWSASQE